MNEKPKEEKFNQEGERVLSDNQYKVIVGVFGIALVYLFFKPFFILTNKYIYTRPPPPNLNF